MGVGDVHYLTEPGSSCLRGERRIQDGGVDSAALQNGQQCRDALNLNLDVVGKQPPGNYDVLAKELRVADAVVFWGTVSDPRPRYAAAVPRFIPRRLIPPLGGDWSLVQWVRNSEYQAWLGSAAALVGIKLWQLWI